MPEAQVLSRLRPETGHGRNPGKWLVNRLVGRPQGHLMVAARDAFVSEYPAFAKLSWSMVDQHRGHESYPVDSRFGAATHFWACFGRVASLRAVADKRFVLMDEGLLQRLISLWSPEMSERQMDSFLSAMPAPSAAILVVADEAVAIERIRSRRRWSGNHLGMNDEQLREFTRNVVTYSQVVGNAVSRKGIPVCSVDAGADPGTNLATMAEFLRALK